MPLYLVAYDIADPRRLRRVARFWERHAVRRQKSVFLLRATSRRLADLFRQALTLIDPCFDQMEAWQVESAQPEGCRAGPALPALPAVVVFGGPQAQVVPEQ